MIFATTCRSDAVARVRPVDPGRDMGAIADLIEIAFRGELDRSSSSLIADMRNLAALGPLLTVVDRIVPIAGGYVWEENGRLLGNVTVTLDNLAARCWLVSNVAVHPRHQGRGIGRQLMEAALDNIRRRDGRQVLLQVRTDNEPAQRLYRRLGFRRFDTLAELVRPRSLPAPARTRPGLRRLKSADWPALLDLARAATPPEVQEVRPLRPEAFRPTLGKRLRALFDNVIGGRQTTRWGLTEGEALLAVASVLVQEANIASRLDLTVRPDARGPLEGPLADFGLSQLPPRAVAANVSTSHQEAIEALQERHFVALRTLDQLILQLPPTP